MTDAAVVVSLSDSKQNTREKTFKESHPDPSTSHPPSASGPAASHSSWEGASTSASGEAADSLEGLSKGARRRARKAFEKKEHQPDKEPLWKVTAVNEASEAPETVDGVSKAWRKKGGQSDSEEGSAGLKGKSSGRSKGGNGEGTPSPSGSGTGSCGSGIGGGGGGGGGGTGIS